MTLPFAARERVPLHGVIKQKFVDLMEWGIAFKNFRRRFYRIIVFGFSGANRVVGWCRGEG